MALNALDHIHLVPTLREEVTERLHEYRIAAERIRRIERGEIMQKRIGASN